MQRNGIKPKTSAPFKPSSNGQTEHYVHIMQTYKGSIQQKLSIFLLQYRKPPNATSHSPAMLFLKRDIQSRIDLLLPQLKSRIQEKYGRELFEFRDRNFDISDSVIVRDYKSANSKWKFVRIIHKDTLHYSINVQGPLVRHHVDQIRTVGEQVSTKE